MVDSMLPLPGLSPVAEKDIFARVDGGSLSLSLSLSLSSDGGVLVLREIERRLGVAERFAACIADPRDPDRTAHRLAEIIRFRLLAIAAGYADGNDATSLRREPLFKMALERLPSGRDLCSQSTISRLENRMGRAGARCARRTGNPRVPFLRVRFTPYSRAEAGPRRAWDRTASRPRPAWRSRCGRRRTPTSAWRRRFRLLVRSDGS